MVCVVLRTTLVFIIQLYSATAFAENEIVNSFDIGVSPYPAGSIAIEAYPNWELVVLGPIPTILGAMKYGVQTSSGIAPALKVVAIVSEDVSAHALVVSQDRYDRIAADPAKSLPNEKLLLIPNSTGQLFAERCLAGWNINFGQMGLVKDEQAKIIKALIDKTANVAVVWTPYSYLAAISAAAKILPCPDVANLEIPAFIVARADLLSETDAGRLAANRKRIANFVAKALGKWAGAKANPAEAVQRLVKTYADQLIKVTDEQARAELEARRPPDFDAQRVAFKAPVGGGDPPLAMTLKKIIDFMVSTKTLSAVEKPNGNDLLDSSILEFIANDPTLAATARGTH
jgi:hypothetical protein